MLHSGYKSTDRIFEQGQGKEYTSNRVRKEENGRA
jgi:hypothetical protein